MLMLVFIYTRDCSSIKPEWLVISLPQPWCKPLTFNSGHIPVTYLTGHINSTVQDQTVNWLGLLWLAWQVTMHVSRSWSVSLSGYIL